MISWLENFNLTALSGPSDERARLDEAAEGDRECAISILTAVKTAKKKVFLETFR